jgi:hypothetical protein
VRPANARRCERRSSPARSAVGSASSARPRSLSNVRERRDVVKAESRPKGPAHRPRITLRMHVKATPIPKLPPRSISSTRFARHRQATPAGQGRLRRLTVSRGLHTGRTLPLDIPGSPAPFAPRRAKHDFFQRTLVSPLRRRGLRWIASRLPISRRAGRLHRPHCRRLGAGGLCVRCRCGRPLVLSIGGRSSRCLFFRSTACSSRCSHPCGSGRRLRPLRVSSGGRHARPWV